MATLQTIRTLELQAVTIREVVAAGSSYVDEHRHRRAHLTVVASGMITDRVNDIVEVLRTGDVLFHPPGIAHANTVAEPGSRGIVIEIDDFLLSRFSGAWEGRPPSIRATAHALQRIPYQLVEELQVEDDVTPMLLESLVVEVLCRIVRSAGGLLRAPRPQWLVHVIKYIDSHHAEPLGPADVARIAGVSPLRLRNALRKFYGRTLAEILRERRIAAAVELLDTGRPLRDIALECGFYDQAHFTRAFQAVRGMSPRKYRERLS